MTGMQDVRPQFGFEKVLVTGGAGFIGSNFVLSWLGTRSGKAVTLDKLTYAGNLQNLAAIENDPRHSFVQGDIADAALLAKVFAEHRPSSVVHFAAESHVDRSIHAPTEFIRTNVLGTFELLQASLHYWRSLKGSAKQRFRFVHVSTDEVFGSLDSEDPAFDEDTPYRPNSPYSASKAGSDHLVRAYFHTYGLPTIITNCSNNYGPFQFPEKLIPLLVINALSGKPLPIYGDGLNVRDWLYVLDHCHALIQVLEKGRPGDVYAIGGYSERTNLQVAHAVCSSLDKLHPAEKPYASLITHVPDRPGHDRRYAINATKISDELGWRPAETFESGIAKTVEWYLSNRSWIENVLSGGYRQWMERNYADRTGTCAG